METKPMTKIKARHYEQFMREKVIPAIKEHWPQSDRRARNEIVIQADNAPVHSHSAHSALESHADSLGLNVTFKPQPANSPDFNDLDLGIFNSIQSSKEQEMPRNIDELISVVEKAYWSLSRDTLDDIFLSLQANMIDSLAVDGNNNFKQRHLKKGKLRRKGILPRSLHVDGALIAQGRELLDDPSALERLERSRRAIFGTVARNQSVNVSIFQTGDGFRDVEEV